MLPITNSMYVEFPEVDRRVLNVYKCWQKQVKNNGMCILAFWHKVIFSKSNEVKPLVKWEVVTCEFLMWVNQFWQVNQHLSPNLRSLLFAESCQAEQKNCRTMKTLVKRQNQLVLLRRTKASQKNVLWHDSKEC